MRYLHVISSMDPRGGGPAEGVRQLCLAGTRNGHDVEIATLDRPDAPWAGESPCPMHLLGPTRLGTYRYAPRLRPWLRENLPRFDAVVVDGLWQYHGLATWRATRRTGTPYFVFTHGMLDPWFRREYPLKHLKKWLYWPWSEYRLLRDARGVLFTCEEERLQARQSFSLYKAREIVVAFGTPGPPADDPATQCRAFLTAFPQLYGRRFLLFLGRIHPKKGCDLLLEAFAQVAARDPGLTLVMAGPDPDNLRRDLLARAPTLDPARVVWTGMLAGAAKWGAFRSAEAFILPSHQENFGIAVAEALACGTPVLISNKVNIWREIEAGGAGIVAPDTIDGTRELLWRWIELGPAGRSALARRAEAVFRSRFHIDRAAQNLLEVLQANTGHQSPPRIQLAT
jgi:glycosyltransferase involved in cell wall biosynthesis